MGPVHGKVDLACAVLGPARGLGQKLRVGGDARLLQRGRVADQHPPALDLGRKAAARAGLDRAGGGGGDPARPGGGEDRGPQGMLGPRLGRGGQRQRPLGVEPGRVRAPGQRDARHLRPALGQRPGLVQRDRPRLGQALQRVAAAKQDPEFCPAPRPDHDRDRDREPHRAGAGDDQDRDRGDQRAPRIARKQQPQHEGQQRKAHDRGHEDRGDPIDQRLHGQPRGLRLRDQRDDARKDRVVAHRLDPQAQRGGAVDRAPRHPLARAADRGDRLARQHRFVDRPAAFGDDAIDGDPLARAQMHDVARAQLGHRQLDRAAGALDQRGGRRQLDQVADRLACPAARPRLEPAAQQDQRDDDRGRLVIDVARLGRQDPRQEGRADRIAPGGQRAQRDQAVHLGRAAQQRRQAEAQEDPPRAHEHQGGQHELGPPQRVLPDRPGQAVMQPRDQVAAHLDGKDRQRQHQRPQEGPAQRAGIGGMVVQPRRVGAGEGPGRIAAIRNRAGQRLGRGRGVVDDARRAGRKVHAGRGDARQRFERALHPRRT